MSKNQMSFGAEIVGDGQLIMDDKELFIHFLRSHKGRFKVVLKAEAKARSLDANAYYWAEVIKRTAVETGHTRDEVHEAWKLKFNPKVINFRHPIFEEAKKIAKSFAGSQPKSVKLLIWNIVVRILKYLGVTEKTMMIPGSTALMDSYAFSIYLEQCMADGAQMGIKYQSPDEWREEQAALGLVVDK